MSDRRNARAARLLDPTWHGMRDALDRLYAEVELDARVLALNVTVANDDGTSVCYGVELAHPGRIQRYVLADPAAIADAMRTAVIDGTVEGEL